MAQDNELPIQIIIDPTGAKSGADQVVISINDIPKRVKGGLEQLKKDINNALTPTVFSGESPAEKQIRRVASSQAKFEQQLQTAGLKRQKQIDDISNRELAAVAKVEAAQTKSQAAFEQRRQSSQAKFEQQLQTAGLKRQKQIDDISNRELAAVAKVEAAQIKAANKAAQKQTFAQSPQGIFQQAGIRSPQDVAQELQALRQAKQLWLDAGKSTEGYQGALQKINSQMNVLEFGNARARGSFHKMIASVASLTFEMTGAIFALTTIASMTAAPVVFGMKFLKDIEDAKMGIAGTVLSMANLSKVGMTVNDAMSISSNIISQLSGASLKYNVSLADTAKLFQAIVGPGLAAGMTMEEVGKMATIGTVAVKSMGLDSRQVVQEVRDLVQGGIQAASSTLATALGLKDKDIKAAKESAEGLFTFLEKRMSGFVMMSMERNNTLSGAWDMLWMKVQRLFADPTMFTAVVDAIKQVSNAVATIETDEFGNFKGLKFNEDLVKAVDTYVTAIKNTVTAIGYLVEIGIKVGSVLYNSLGPILAVAIGTKLLPLFPAMVIAVRAFYTEVAIASAGMGAMGVAATAVSTVVTTAMGKISATAIAAGKNGLIGLALFGAGNVIYNIIDSLFNNVEDRINLIQIKLKGMGVASLESQKQDLIDEYNIKLAALGKQNYAYGAGKEMLAAAGLGESEVKNLQALENQIEAINRLLPAKRAEEAITKSKAQLGAQVQQGAEKEAAFQKAYETSNPEAKRLKAVSEAGRDYEIILKGISAAQFALATSNLKPTERLKEEAALRDRATAAARNYKFALDEANKPTSEEKKANARELKIIDQLNAFSLSVEKAKEEYAKFNDINEDTVLGMQLAEKILAKLGITTGAVAEQFREMGAELDKNKTLLAEGKIYQDMGKHLKDMVDGTDEYTKSLNDSLLVREAELDMVGLSAVGVEYRKIEIGLTDQLTKSQEKYNLALDEARKLAGKEKLIAEKNAEFVLNNDKNRAIAAANDARVRVTNIFEREEAKKTVDTIEGYFHDGWNKLAENGKGTWKQMIETFRSTFKKSVIEYIYKELAKPFILKVIASVAGIMGAPGIAGAAQTALSGASGGAGFPSSIPGAGWFNDFGSTAVQAMPESWGLTTMRGAPDGSFSAITDLTSTGNTIAEGLDILGDAVGYASAIYAAREGKWGQAIGSAAGTYFGGPIGAAIGSAVGKWVDDFFGGGGGDKLGGGITKTIGGKVSDTWASSGGDVFKSEKAVDTSIGIISGIAEQYGKKLGESFSFGLFSEMDPEGNAPGQVGYVLNGVTTRRQIGGQDMEAGAKEFAVEAQRGILAALQSIDLSPIIDPLLDGLTSVGTMTEEQIQKTLTMIGSLAGTSVAQVETIFGETFDVTKFTELSKEGENLIDTFARLTAEFTLTNTLVRIMGKDIATAFGDIGLASTSARASLIEMMGGLDAAANLTKSYYQNFYTETEQLNNNIADVALGFSGLGLEMPKTREEFRLLVEAQDPATESGRALIAGLLKLAPAFASVTKPMEDASAALGKFTEDVVRMVNDIHESVTSSIFEMQYGMLDNQGKYGMLDVQGAQFNEQMRKSTDIYEIADLASKSIDLINKSWGLLSPEQQKATFGQFETKLNAIDMFVTSSGADAISLKKQETKDMSEAVAAAVEKALSDLADKIAAATVEVANAKREPATVTIEVTNATSSEVQVY